jgi:hypothetical protein
MRFLIRIGTVNLLFVVALGAQDGPQDTPAQIRLQQRRMQLQQRFPNGQPVQVDPVVYPTPTPTPPPPQPRAGFPPQPAATQQPTPAPAPPLPDLPPPVAPQVTYHDGLLTVQTTNSTLGGVLSAIRNKTGIQFEGLEGVASERIALSLGPAPEGEVLAAILGGTRYDFVAIDRPDSPGIVQRVILSVRGGSSPPVDGQGVVSNPSPEGDDDEAEDTDPEGLKAPQDTPNRPPLVQAQQPQPQPQPQNIPPVPNSQQVEPSAGQQPNQQTPPTAEQLLKKLQDMGQQPTQPNAAPIKQPPQPPQPQ